MKNFFKNQSQKISAIISDPTQMGRKNKSGSSGQPADDNGTNTGSKRGRDSGDKSGLTPDEKVTKNIHGKDKSLTETNSSMNSSVSNENNDNLAAPAATLVQNMDMTGSGGDSGVTHVSPGASPNKQNPVVPLANEQQTVNNSNSNVACNNYRESSLLGSETEDDDLPPLTTEDEEQLRRQSDPTATDEPATKKTKSFAEAAKQKRAFEILYVHKGTKERAAIDKETFYKLMDKYQNRALVKGMNGETFPDNILWHSWSKGRGLVAVEDKETSDYFIKEVAVLKVNKMVFRAWHRDQASEGKLVSVWLAGNGYSQFGPDQLTGALRRQNDLKGQVTGAKFSNVGKGGRLLLFFADKTLWTELLARSTTATGGKAVLKLGTFRVVAQLSRSVPTVEGLSLGGPEEAAGTSSGAKAGCSED